MTISQADLQRNNRQDDRALYVGTAVTAVATVVLFVAPTALPVEELKLWVYETSGVWVAGENPLVSLRFLGGVVGGAVTGWLTPELGSGSLNGTKAALYGLGLVYCLFVVLFTAYQLLVVGRVPPPIVATAAAPAVYAIPMFFVYLVGGLFAGLLADALS